MIDITTINTTPLPEELIKVQTMNKQLSTQNKLLAVAVCLGIYFLVFGLADASLRKMEDKRNGKSKD